MIDPVNPAVRTSAEVDQIAPALAKAFAAIKPIEKNAANPFFKSKYADIAAVDHAIRPALVKNSLFLIQTVGNGYLTTRVMHSTGQWVESDVRYVEPEPYEDYVLDKYKKPVCHPTTGEPLKKMVQPTPQMHGSAGSYARRYGAAQAVGAVVSDATDDDGNAASGNSKKQKRAAPKFSLPKDADWLKGARTNQAGFPDFAKMDEAEVKARVQRACIQHDYPESDPLDIKSLWKAHKYLTSAVNLYDWVNKQQSGASSVTSAGDGVGREETTPPAGTGSDEADGAPSLPVDVPPPGWPFDDELLAKWMQATSEGSLGALLRNKDTTTLGVWWQAMVRDLEYPLEGKGGDPVKSRVMFSQGKVDVALSRLELWRRGR